MQVCPWFVIYIPKQFELRKSLKLNAHYYFPVDMRRVGSFIGIMFLVMALIVPYQSLADLNVHVTDVSQTVVKFEWDKPIMGSVKYYLVWREGGEDDSLSVLATLNDPDAVSYVDTGLDEGTLYLYVVEAYDDQAILIDRGNVSQKTLVPCVEVNYDNLLLGLGLIIIGIILLVLLAWSGVLGTLLGFGIFGAIGLLVAFGAIFGVGAWLLFSSGVGSGLPAC